MSVRLNCTKPGITENARELLRKRFPFLLSLRQDEALSHLSSAARAPRDEKSAARNRGLDVDFKEFLLSIYGEAGQPDISTEIELFKALLAEVESGSLEEA